MLRISAVLIVVLAVQSSRAAEVSDNSMLNTWTEPSPGEQFYIETHTASRKAIEISSPFESKMPGSMKLRFKFAIDEARLLPLREDDKFVWYAAGPGKARAWHGMLGSVLARGDTVGLRIPKSGSTAQWFVDNSIHNGFTTVWHRKHDPRKDPSFRSIDVDDLLNSSWRALRYQGQRDGQLVFELETGEDREISHREFLYPMEAFPMQIGMQGLRAEVSSVNNVGIRIRVTKPFSPLSVALPAIDQSSPLP